MPTKFPVPPVTRTVSSTATRLSSSPATTAFRECYERYQDCLEYRDWQSNSSLNEKVENYVLDFELSARRAFGSDSTLSKLFQLMFVEQRSAQHCSLALKMDRFTLAGKSREVETLVGEALVRRGLFPLNRYFDNGSAQTSESPANLTRLAA